MIKAQFRNFKKNRILVCFSLLLSVILSLSAPFSITSYASSIGIPMGIPVDSFLASFYSFLLGHGYVPDSISNPFTSDRLDPSSLSESFSFFDELNSYKEGLGDEVQSAIIAGTLDGKFLLSEEGQKDFLEYLQLTGTIPLFSNRVDLPLNPAGTTTTITVKYRAGSDPTVYTDVITFTPTQPYLVLLQNTDYPNEYYRWFTIITLDGSTVPISISKGNTAFNPSYSSSIGNRTYQKTDGSTFTAGYSFYRIGNYYNGYPFFTTEVYQVNTHYFMDLRYFDLSTIADILYNMIHDGEAYYDSTATASSVAGSQDIVSSASTVNENAEVEGGFSGVVVPLDTLTELINAIKSGVLSIKDALRTIGLNSVPSDATTEEKQQAINNIVEVIPSTSITDIDVDSSGIAVSESKIGTLAHIEHAIANAIARATGRPLPYPNEDPDYVPPGDPHIQDWVFPSLDPDDPDPGGSEDGSEEDRNRAAEVAGGIGVVAGLAVDIFNSSSGFNLITTIGYSFVIFSAILGASHFFGALGGKKNDVRSKSSHGNKSVRSNSKDPESKSDK